LEFERSFRVLLRLPIQLALLRRRASISTRMELRRRTSCREHDFAAVPFGSANRRRTHDSRVIRVGGERPWQRPRLLIYRRRGKNSFSAPHGGADWSRRGWLMCDAAKLNGPIRSPQILGRNSIGHAVRPPTRGRPKLVCPRRRSAMTAQCAFAAIQPLAGSMRNAREACAKITITIPP